MVLSLPNPAIAEPIAKQEQISRDAVNACITTTTRISPLSDSIKVHTEAECKMAEKYVEANHPNVDKWEGHNLFWVYLKWIEYAKFDKCPMTDEEVFEKGRDFVVNNLWWIDYAHQVELINAYMAWYSDFPRKCIIYTTEII